MKTKMLQLLTMWFVVTDWAFSGIYKELKAYLRYHVLQIQHIEFLLIAIAVFNNETC